MPITLSLDGAQFTQTRILGSSKGQAGSSVQRQIFRLARCCKLVINWINLYSLIWLLSPSGLGTFSAWLLLVIARLVGAQWRNWTISAVSTLLLSSLTVQETWLAWIVTSVHFIDHRAIIFLSGHKAATDWAPSSQLLARGAPRRRPNEAIEIYSRPSHWLATSHTQHILFIISFQSCYCKRMYGRAKYCSL